MIPATETLLIHCSDHRVAHACSKFVALELKEPVFDVVAVPGGPQFLRALEYMPKFTWAGRRWLRFMMESHKIRRVILIAHEDCAWYRHLHGEHQVHVERQKEDLHHATADLTEWFPGLHVESYFATGIEGEVTFTKVD